MSYQEFQPDNKFSHLIDCYWTSQGAKSVIHRVLPDGCADVIFNFGETITNVQNNKISVEKESIAAIGMMTTYRDVSSIYDADLLGIRFKSGGLSLLTNASISDLKNNSTLASDILPEFNNLYLEELFHTKDIKEKIALIEKTLGEIVVNSGVKSDELVRSAVDLIIQSKGQMQIRDIAAAACISLRQLQRRFEAKVGIGLKEYAKVIRFINTAATLKSAPQKSILQVAFEHGYYDHAHLSNDFMRIAGSLPSDLK